MFLQGLLIGLAIAVPVGPVGFLCLRRTLVYGRLTGFVSGLGAATADALYGVIAALGLTAISGFLLGIERWLQVGGGMFLVALGLKMAFARPPRTGNDTPPQRSLPAAFLSTFALTLANPVTLVAFVAIFAGLGLHAAPTALAAGMMIAGVFAGSGLWWLALSYGAHALFRRLHADALRVMHMVAGGCIVALGVWQLWLFFAHLAAA